MALAKLLKIHRRTDFEKLMHYFDKMMRPEYYSTQAAKATEMLARLLSIAPILEEKGIRKYF